MGRVDRLDQMTRQNKSKKTMKWYRRIEQKMTETSVYNAYVIEGSVIDHSKRDFLSFKLDLIHGLIGDNFKEKTSIGRPRSLLHNDHRLDGINHWPVRGEGKGDNRCAVCSKKYYDFKARNPAIVRIGLRRNLFSSQDHTMKVIF